MLSILKAAMVENDTFKKIGSDIQKVIFEKAVRDYGWSKKMDYAGILIKVL